MAEKLTISQAISLITGCDAAPLAETRESDAVTR